MNLSFFAQQFAKAFKGAKAVVVRHDAYAAEVYHYNACICKLKADGSLILDNGDYYTKTTKKHLNTCLECLGLPTRITQKDFSWFFSDGKEFHRNFQLI